VTNCTFSGNSAEDYGGGMYNTSSSPTVTNCTFSGNSANVGGGMYNSASSPIITNCTFTGNSAYWYGGGMRNYANSSPNVTNCTFTGNSVDVNLGAGGGMANGDDSSPTVTNCILWGNTPDEIFDDLWNTVAVTFSDVLGGYTGTGNFSADPLFTDAQAGNFRLLGCSPCVDAGNNAVVPPAVTTDLAGNLRFVDDHGVVDEGAGTPPIVDMGAYERQLDTSAWSVHNITQDTWYCSIQAAIDNAVNYDQIEVQPGTYNQVIDFNGLAVRVYSSDGPEVTTIDGTGNYHVVKCISGEDANTILEGFTITGGNANGLFSPDDRGG
jgi:parallel beta-helix repeat protein